MREESPRAQPSRACGGRAGSFQHLGLVGDAVRSRWHRGNLLRQSWRDAGAAQRAAPSSGLKALLEFSS